MKKSYIYIIAIIMGLIINFVLYIIVPVKYSGYSDSKYSKCHSDNSISLENCYNQENISVGKPFVFTTEIIVPDSSLAGASEDYKLTIFSDYVKSWQFYANATIFSLPIMVVFYLYNKKHENTRD